MSKKALNDQVSQVREMAMQDLRVFAKLVNPHRVYGQLHLDVFKWWMDCEEKESDNTCVHLPRDHRNSHCAAVKAA